MSPLSPMLPAACAIAYKEWAGVCLAVASGRQSILLRKGGIAEGPHGFEPKHAVFWLYPTFVHQAEQGLRAEAPASVPPPGAVDLGVLVRVEGLGYLDCPDALDHLTDLHIWTAETIRHRFEYRRPGLWLLVVRAFRRPEPLRIPEEPSHAGCRTWVPLKVGLPTAGLVPALDDEAFAAVLGQLRPVLDAGRPVP